MKLKAKYDKLKEKYSLPDYKSLNMNFDIEDINSESEIVLARIRGKIHEKIEHYSSIIESIVQPDTNLSNMFEAKYTDDKQKESAYLLFKSMMGLLRYSNLVSLSNSEEENAVFIKKSNEKWETMKKEIESHIERLIGAWKKDTNVKSDLSYFG